VHRPSATPEDLYGAVYRLHLVRADGSGDYAARLAELEQQAELVARHVARLREQPLFARDDISERQADELESRLRKLRQSMADIAAARQTP
jgi:hypothetical protein